LERRRTSAQLLNLRKKLDVALGLNAPSSVSPAQERILEQKFFASPVTPAPARVVDFSAARPRIRF
jgi:hypothetical protein